MFNKPFANEFKIKKCAVVIKVERWGINIDFALKMSLIVGIPQRPRDLSAVSYRFLFQVIPAAKR